MTAPYFPLEVSAELRRRQTSKADREIQSARDGADDFRDGLDWRDRRTRCSCWSERAGRDGARSFRPRKTGSGDIKRLRDAVLGLAVGTRLRLDFGERHDEGQSAGLAGAVVAHESGNGPQLDVPGAAPAIDQHGFEWRPRGGPHGQPYETVGFHQFTPGLFGKSGTVVIS